MTVYESLHKDDYRVVASAIRVECAVCRGEGRKDCRHQPRLIEVNEGLVADRNEADVLRNIGLEYKF